MPGEEVLVVGLHGASLTLDPHHRDEAVTISVLGNIFEALVDTGADSRPLPSLAESWESVDDLTWRFRIRSGVRFHDGRALSARDVAFSLERARNQPSSDLRGYLVEISEVRWVDDLTLEVSTHRPTAILLQKLRFVFVVPEGSPSQIEIPIGTGPYRFTARRDDGGVDLERFKEYRLPHSGVSRVEFRASRNGTQRLDGLLAGTLDLVDEVPAAELPRVAAAACCRIESTEGQLVEYLHLDPAEPPFGDRRVRLAIDLAVDRAALVESQLDGHGLPAGQLVPRGVFGFVPHLTATKRNLAEARKLLDESGYPSGFEATLFLREGRNASHIIRQLAEIGIRVHESKLPWQILYQHLLAGDIAFYYGGFVTNAMDASQLLDTVVHSVDLDLGYGSGNFIGYRNLEVDRLIEDSGATLNMKKRRELLQRAVELSQEDLVFIPLTEPSVSFGVAQTIEWRPRSDGYVRAIEIRFRGSLQ